MTAILHPHTLARPAAPAAAVRGWAGIARATAVLTLVGSAAIHASAVEQHAAEWRLAGVVFVLLGTTETFLAVALVTSRARLLLQAALVASLGTIALWTLSRTAGVPIGPAAWAPEPVGAADAIATALETATAVALLPLLLPAPGRQARAALLAAVCLSVAAGTLLGVRDDAHRHGAVADRGHSAPARLPSGYRSGQYYLAQAPLGRFAVRLGVAPATAGTNTIDLVVEDELGGRVELDRLRLAGRHGGERVAFRARRIAPGHFVVDAAALASPGAWRLRLDARVRGAGPVHTTLPVPIAR